jgi:hypothetical protein
MENAQLLGGNSIARRAIWAALEDDPSKLANRLREGAASADEMAFVADLIEGKTKARRLRSGQPTRSLNDNIVQTYFQYLLRYPKWPKKKIVGKVADIARVRERHVYNLLEALSAECREIHERQAPGNIEALRIQALSDEEFLEEISRDEELLEEIRRDEEWQEAHKDEEWLK